MPSDDFGRDDDRGRDPDPDRDSDADWDRDSDPDRDAWGSSDSSPTADPTPPSDPSDGWSTPRDASPPDDPESFGDRLSDGWDRALDHLSLALVPLLSSLLAVDNVERVLEFRGLHFGLAFRFPATLPDLWTFVSLPSREAGVHVSPGLFALPVLILVRAALVAGLVGSVHEVLRTGRYDFGANSRRHFGPVLVFVALVRTAGFAAFSMAVVLLPLALLLFPLFIVASYLFYATPYLLVVADLGVADALGKSYEWAVDGGPYFAYGAGYLLFVAAVSLVASALVVNLGALGILVGAVASAPVALALTFATTGFVADMVDDPEFYDARGRSDSQGWS